MIQVVRQGEPFSHRVVSIHKRIPLHSAEPPTYWLTITAPWKRMVYEIATDSEVLKHPRYSFGFRFWGPA